MLPVSSQASEYARANRPRFVEELKQFLRFPSISGQPKHARDVQACARWLAEHLRAIGMQHVRVVPTARHPIVYADWRGAAGRPTVLIYGHYDVQPVDPLAEWRIPPFQSEVRNGYLHARGASDDKGQLFVHLKALESYLRTAGRLPINVTCCFEGEEEIGSPNLFDFLRRHRNEMAADAAVISDTSIPALDRPAITYALRGGLALDLEVAGPARDLHSGHFGGAIHNPVQVLCEILSQMHDCAGRVRIPGFYDDVRSIDAAQRERMAQGGRSDEEIMRAAGVSEGWGEQGYSAFERTTIRPALTINGISGGYSGPGGKGIVPARASAKVSFRLVPEQRSDDIERLFRAFVRQIAPTTVRMSIRRNSASLPVVLDRRHPVFHAASEAYRQGFGVRPQLVRSGGSIPIVETLASELGITTALMGFGLPGDRVHAPNERFSLRSFFAGIATCIAFHVHAVRLSESNATAPYQLRAAVIDG